jgi:hypothetical protein
MAGGGIGEAALIVSIVAAVAGGGAEIYTASKSATMQTRNVREQQVQLRLQQSQNSIERMKELQRVLAAEEVSFGERNISPASGSARALVTGSFNDFIADENADLLNYGAKQLALSRQKDLISLQKKAQIFGAVTNTVGKVAGAYALKGQGASPSLIAASQGVPSAASGITYQNYQKQRNLTNLNA